MGDTKAINAFIQSKAQSEQWQAQIDYSDSPEAVSTDFVGSEKVAILMPKQPLLLITVPPYMFGMM